VQLFDPIEKSRKSRKGWKAGKALLLLKYNGLLLLVFFPPAGSKIGRLVFLIACFRYYTRADAEHAMRFINGTRLDDRIVRTDWDAGFKEGRQYGRGKTGGQVKAIPAQTLNTIPLEQCCFARFVSCGTKCRW